MINKLRSKIIEKVGLDFYELIIHSKNYLTGDVFSRGIVFLSTPIFIRMLSTEEFGTISIFNSFIAFFTILFSFGLNGAIGRFYYDNSINFKEFLGSNILFNLIWSFFLACLTYLFSLEISKFFKISQNLVFFGILIAFFLSFIGLLKSYLEASKQSLLFSKINVLKSLFFISISVLLTYVFSENKVYGQVIGNVLVCFFFFLFSFFFLKKISKLSFNFSHSKTAILFGFPIIFHLLSQFILTSFDKIMIINLFGKEETALYSFAFQLGLIQNIFTMAVLKSWTPVFYEKLNLKQYKDINIIIKKYSKIIYLSAFFLVIFSEEIANFLGTKSYYSSIDIIPVIVIAYVFFFFYIIYVGYSFYLKKTKFIAFFTIIAGLINICLNYYFLPLYGYKFAAISTLISYVFLSIFHYLYSSVIKEKISIIKLGSLLPDFSILILTTVLFYFCIDNNFPFYVNLIIKFLFFLSFSLILFLKGLIKYISN